MSKHRKHVTTDGLLDCNTVKEDLLIENMVWTLTRKQLKGQSAEPRDTALTVLHLRLSSFHAQGLRATRA